MLRLLAEEMGLVPLQAAMHGRRFAAWPRSARFQHGFGTGVHAAHGWCLVTACAPGSSAAAGTSCSQALSLREVHREQRVVM